MSGELADGRRVEVRFEPLGGAGTRIRVAVGDDDAPLNQVEAARILERIAGALPPSEAPRR